MSDGAGQDPLGRGRDAAARRGWQQAVDLMSANADDPLTAADLAVLGEVAYAAGELDLTIEAWERAHAGNLQAGDQSPPWGRPSGSRCTSSSTLHSRRRCVAGWHRRSSYSHTGMRRRRTGGVRSSAAASG
jgi:hypothetical protein